MSLFGSSDPTNGRLVTDYVRCKSVDQKWFAVLGLSRGKELRAKPGRKGASRHELFFRAGFLGGWVNRSLARGKGTVVLFTLPTVVPDKLAP